MPGSEFGVLLDATPQVVALADIEHLGVGHPLSLEDVHEFGRITPFEVPAATLGEEGRRLRSPPTDDVDAGARWNDGCTKAKFFESQEAIERFAPKVVDRE